MTCGRGGAGECLLDDALVVVAEYGHIASYVGEHILEGGLCGLDGGVGRKERFFRPRLPVNGLPVGGLVFIGDPFFVVGQFAIQFLTNVAAYIGTLGAFSCALKLVAQQHVL